MTATMDPTTLGIISAVGTTLLGAIGALWKQSLTREKDDKKRYKTQQDDHKVQQSALLAVTKEVGELKGKVSMAETVHSKIDGIHPKLDKIEDLMEETIKEIGGNGN